MLSWRFCSKLFVLYTYCQWCRGCKSLVWDVAGSSQALMAVCTCCTCSSGPQLAKLRWCSCLVFHVLLVLRLPGAGNVKLHSVAPVHVKWLSWVRADTMMAALVLVPSLQAGVGVVDRERHLYQSAFSKHTTVDLHAVALLVTIVCNFKSLAATKLLQVGSPKRTVAFSPCLPTHCLGTWSCLL